MSIVLSEENLLFTTDRIFDVCNQKRFQRFDGFFPVVEELFDANDTDYGFFFDVKPTDLEQKVNSSAFVFGKPEGNGAKKQAQLIRFREISRKELRKRTGVFALSPYCLEVGFEKFPKTADAFYQMKGESFVPIHIPGYE